MQLGVVLALAAYCVYSWGDGFIKGFGGTGIGVFEIGFFISLFALLPALALRSPAEPWREALKVSRPRLVHARAIAGTAASMLVTYSFVTIPLAEAYSLIFMTPLFITALAALVLAERVGGRRWTFVLLSFAGVLLVVRPGFRDLQLGHLTALLCAVCAASASIMLRMLAGREKQTSLILVSAGYALCANFVLMLPTFVVPTLQQFGFFALAGGLIGTGNILIIMANRHAPASQVAPMQYSQIVWAILIGSAFYDEQPDLLAFAGLALVTLSGLANIAADGPLARVANRFAEMRIRRSEKDSVIDTSLP